MHAMDAASTAGVDTATSATSAAAAAFPALLSDALFPQPSVLFTGPLAGVTGLAPAAEAAATAGTLTVDGVHKAGSRARNEL